MSQTEPGGVSCLKGCPSLGKMPPAPCPPPLVKCSEAAAGRRNARSDKGICVEVLEVDYRDNAILHLKRES